MKVAIPHPATELSFGTAVAAMKQGHRVRRAGWNGKGMWIALVQVHGFNLTTGEWPEDWSDMDAEIQPCFVLFTAGGQYQPGWNASTPDVLATDWEVITPTTHEEGK